jgi:hypothetical protein
LNEESIDMLISFEWPLLSFSLSNIETPTFICNNKIKLEKKDQAYLTTDHADENSVYLSQSGSLYRIELNYLENIRDCFLNDKEP